jgi:hypothetical protein
VQGVGDVLVEQDDAGAKRQKLLGPAAELRVGEWLYVCTLLTITLPELSPGRAGGRQHLRADVSPYQPHVGAERPPRRLPV